MEHILSVASGSALFRGIEPDQLCELMNGMSAARKKFKKGEYLLHAGETVEALGLILSGRVLIVKEDLWGNRNLIASLGEGQCFAETFACAAGAVSTVSAVADTDCEVVFLNVQNLLSAPQNAAHTRLIYNLLSDMAGKNLAFTEKLSHLGKRTTRAKLLSYLSAQSQKCGSTEFEIPFSRQQLADYLFVERSGLSAELGKMKKEGLIDFERNRFQLFV